MYTSEFQIEIYASETGEAPFVEWLESLREGIIRNRIKERLDRVRLGNLGDYKPIAEGVFELRFAFGAGYRVYFGHIDQKIVLLLCGGDKSTQQKDIKKAISYWKDYIRGIKNEKKH